MNTEFQKLSYRDRDLYCVLDWIPLVLMKNYMDPHLEKKICQVHLTRWSFNQDLGAWWLLIIVVRGDCVGLLEKRVRTKMLSSECDRASLSAATPCKREHRTEIVEWFVSMFYLLPYFPDKWSKCIPSYGFATSHLVFLKINISS